MRRDVLAVGAQNVESLLAEADQEVFSAVRDAYLAHGNGKTSLPHSTFLRFPGDSKNRIIALPAYVANGKPVAGIKWISSFPDNLKLSVDRASAIIILNSPDTGHPEAILEGSEISAVRTAASAALAAQVLHPPTSSFGVSLIGCGRINFTILRFLRCVFPESIDSLCVFDIDMKRAQAFAGACQARYSIPHLAIADNLTQALSQSSLICFATTAASPYVDAFPQCLPDSTILHISLRDLSPQIILNSDNVVDDPDHVCRAQTSLHLAESVVGHRNFIRASLPDILVGKSAGRPTRLPLIFSPFGLGILDLAVASLVVEMAYKQGQGTVLPSFLPEFFDSRTVENKARPVVARPLSHPA